MVRSASVDSSHASSGASHHSSVVGLIAVVEERRPKSFTVGTLHQRPHHLSSSAAAPTLHHSHGSSNSCSHSAFTHAAGSRAGASKHHSSCLKPQQQPQLLSSAAAGAGRRSPLQHALHSKHHAAFAASGKGYIGSVGSAGGGVGAMGGAAAAGVAGSAGSFTGSGGALGLLGVPKVQRVMSESVKPEAIAKGFAGNWLSRRCLDVFTGARAVAQAEVLRKLLPDCPGLHLWLVKPPRSRHWVPVHLGAAERLRQGAGCYLHDDGSVGPSGEVWKCRVLLDLMCRGFAVQIRFRPAKARCGSLTEDLRAKLARFDFPLNDKDNGGCRPIELPNGWPVVEYPIICDGVNALYEELFGPRRMLL
ncbi:hypothetical protein OEZ86_009256 [Tetradesmus obliquus]|nr:hypothetical protein OEZ86_009256 [Tetradesmus obliquus]